MLSAKQMEYVYIVCLTSVHSKFCHTSMIQYNLILRHTNLEASVFIRSGFPLI